jgi:CheY-like chemotaxis protein
MNASEVVPSDTRGESPKDARPLRVFVADDDRDTALTLVAILLDEGYDARAFNSGRSVMKAVIESSPDAVVLDIDMPEVSGWQVAQTIRARGGRIPLIIGISGYYKKGSDIALAEMSGFHHYLVKPVPPAELVKLLSLLRDPAAAAVRA